MSDEQLRAKLRKINACRTIKEAETIHVGKGDVVTIPLDDDTIALIDQVYKDAGYVAADQIYYKLLDIEQRPRFSMAALHKLRLSLANKVKITEPFMTGRFWHNRFKTELDAEKQFIPVGMYKLMLEIAQKAAGVEL